LVVSRGHSALTLVLAACGFAACNFESAPTPCDQNDGCVQLPLERDAGTDAAVPDAAVPDAAVPELRADGAACERDAQCGSNHCNRGLCCADGNCCQVADDCPGEAGMGMACDDTRSCQGSRGVITCEAFRCVTTDGVADDTACGTVMQADDCGAYRSVFCNGEQEQRAPACPLACRSDNECDPGAHCDGTCVANAGNGERCDGDGECMSGHCVNSVCCADGDCCRTASDCPARFSSAAACTSSSECQGTRTDALCTNNMCGSTTVDDDSACSASILALSCDLSVDIFCNGAVVQAIASCGASCSSDAECDENLAFCSSGTCVTKLANGGECTGNSSCSSGHCNNGVCCGSGSCCRNASQCPGLTVAQCDDPEQCQGTRQEATCEANQCGTRTMPDDSACTSGMGASCGLYADVMCDGAVQQSAPSCVMSCAAGGAGCDSSATCDATNQCVPTSTGG
jgi:hypothetical protein